MQWLNRQRQRQQFEVGGEQEQNIRTASNENCEAPSPLLPCTSTTAFTYENNVIAFFPVAGPQSGHFGLDS